jgi:hypothetical protein
MPPIARTPLVPDYTKEPVCWMVYMLEGTLVGITDNPDDLKPGMKALPLFTGVLPTTPPTDARAPDDETDPQGLGEEEEGETEYATDKEIAIAREVYGNEWVCIDEGAPASRTNDGGTWIQAWVWIHCENDETK